MRLGLTGGAYQAHSVIASAQRSVNLFSEPIPENLTEPAKGIDYPTPGLRLLGTIGTGPIRGIRQGTNGNFYVVSGSEVYSVNTTSWVGTSLGSITAGLTTPVSLCDNTLDMVVVDGTANGWVINLAANTMAPLTDSTGSFVGADKVDYLDTFLIFNKPGTPQFYWTGSLAVDFDALDFANKSSFTDLLQTLIVTKREIWLIGQLTTEIWYDTGATDIAAGSSQFASVQSVFVDHGTCAKYSVAGYDNGAFWLTRDRQGRGFVVMGAGYQTKRVSTYAIEAELAGYARLDDAIGYCYQLAGHTFYVLTFPHADHTWVYDITTGLWHEWLWLDSNGEEHRHRSNCYWPVDGSIPVVGDWQNGNLYALDNRVFTDAGQPIKRVRSFPHMLNDGKRVFYRQFLADIDAGTSTAVAPATFAFLSASFTAADGTAIDAYTSEVGGGWTVVGGASHAVITGDEVVGIGGDALYTAAVVAPRADYSVRFNVVPPAYDTVPTATVMFVAGRADAAGVGYRARVSADGTQYSLSVTVGATVHTTVAMGTISSGIYTAWLVLRGTTIAAQVQRSQDGLWLRGDATWQASSGTTAAQFSDATYTAPGLVAIGGTWPVPDTGMDWVMEGSFGLADATYPSGYSQQSFYRTFDFAANLSYQAVFGTIGGVANQGGIAVADLSPYGMTTTHLLTDMYAGTPYGAPPGSPPSYAIYDIAVGAGTDLYLLTAGTGSLPNEFTRFTRVSRTTWKVTGEYYVSNTIPPPINSIVSTGGGCVNTTSNHTIVAYHSNGAMGAGPQIMDGTGMAPIGMGPTPYPDGYHVMTIPGKKNPDGNCEFIMLSPDYNHPTGNIQIWRIHVSDALVITNTLTGTLNVLSIVGTVPHLYVGQADYDVAHDTIILQVSTDFTPITNPWIMSVNYDGTINWSAGPFGTTADNAAKGMSLINGNSLIIGGTGDLILFDTTTGATTHLPPFTISGATAGSFYHVYDASRRAYYTYALSRGATRITFPPGGLAMDDVVATTEAPLSSNLISLRWSDDRGHSFGNYVSQSMGEVGEYRTSLQWQRLAYARDRVWELSWSVPCSAALQGCWVDVTPAQS